jgi:prephenate dehydratase
MEPAIRVAFPGVRGAFSEDAAHRHFGGDVIALPAGGVDRALAALRDGRAEYCVLPVENSIVGPLGDVHRAIDDAPWAQVAGEVSLPIHQCLLSTGVGLADIQRVFSHPAALAQCRGFLEQRSWMRPVKRRDTASAARFVARRAGSRYGAIASARAATLRGLTVVAADVQDHRDNETRFVVLARR